MKKEKQEEEENKKVKKRKREHNNPDTFERTKTMTRRKLTENKPHVLAQTPPLETEQMEIEELKCIPQNHPQGRNCQLNDPRQSSLMQQLLIYSFLPKPRKQSLRQCKESSQSRKGHWNWTVMA